jgi:hypothetical protein
MKAFNVTLAVLLALGASGAPMLAQASSATTATAEAIVAGMLDGSAWTAPDRSSRPLLPGRGSLAQRLVRAERRIAELPSDLGARLERAWVLAQQGPERRGDVLADIDAALAISMEGDPEYHRAALWSAGWSAIALGDGELALRFWKANLHQTTLRPFWVPYSFAVAHAMDGQIDAAVEWYAIAARDWPQRFATSRALAAYTRHWQPREKSLIEAVYVEWAARKAAAADGAG